MARLPTVTLKRRRNGVTEEQIVNQLDYANFIGKYVAEGWSISTMTRGDATDDQVEFAARQTEKEMARAQNPNTAAGKDEQRAFEARQGTVNIPGDDQEGTAADIDPAAPNAALSVEPPATNEPADWRKMKFFALKIHVKKLTGIDPANKAEAVAAMEAHEAGAKQPA